MNSKFVRVVLVVVAIIAISGLFFPRGNSAVRQIVGSVVGPDLLSPYFSVNEVRHEYTRRALVKATTTPCAIKSPTATSTLIHASVRIDTATSTATTWTIAKATTAFATTTNLFGGTGSFTLGSGVQGVMSYHASSTIAGVDNLDVIAPNQWIVWGVAGTTISDTTKLNGFCQAEFLVN